MKTNVLVIDDDEDLLFLAQRFLGDQYPDIDIASALTAQDALCIIEEQDVDAIVCDYYLGPSQMNGLELLEWVRQKYPILPFIMFTGRSKENLAIKALNLGADYYLRKDAEDMRSLFAELARYVKEAVLEKGKKEAVRIDFSKVEELVKNRTEELTLQIQRMEEKHSEIAGQLKDAIQGQRDIIEFAKNGMQSIENLLSNKINDNAAKADKKDSDQVEVIRDRVRTIVSRTNLIMDSRISHSSSTRFSLLDIMQEIADSEELGNCISIETDLPVVFGDEERIREAFLLLFSTSISYCNITQISVEFQTIADNRTIEIVFSPQSQIDCIHSLFSDPFCKSFEEKYYSIAQAVAILRAHGWRVYLSQKNPSNLILEIR